MSSVKEHTEIIGGRSSHASQRKEQGEEERGDRESGVRERQFVHRPG